MTEAETQLTNLVNNRRVQVGKEPLTAMHILRAARLMLPRRPLPAPLPVVTMPDTWSWPWPLDVPIPFVLTARGKAFLAVGFEP